MLKLDHVSKFYSANGVVTAGFSKVSLDFHIGEFVAITGESGSGKSTLLNVISGLDSYEEGEMYIFGQPTSGFDGDDMERYRKRYIGNIFQTFNLINNYTVYQNVELVLLLAGYSRSEIRPKVTHIINKVGLRKYRNTKTSKLSGGQRQRVAIARALAKETPIIVADEPTGNLDVESAAEIIKLLASLSREKLIIIVTHNYDQVESYVNRKITMHDGRVIEDRKLTPKQVVGPDGTVYSMDQAPEDLRPHVRTDEELAAAAQASQRPHSAQVKKRSSKAKTKENETPAPVQEARSGSLSFGSTLRLGIRNTFSLPAKLILLIFVFLFLCLGTFSLYASYQDSIRSTSDGSMNSIFLYGGEKRLVLTKADHAAFSDDEIEQLKTYDNVASVEKYDVLLDSTCSLTTTDPYSETEESAESDLYITVNARSTGVLKKHSLKSGRMPEQDDEAVLLIPRGSGYLADEYEQMGENSLYLTCDSASPIATGMTTRVKVVGYAYMSQDESQDFLTNMSGAECCLCLPDSTLQAVFREARSSGTTLEARTNQTVFPVGNGSMSQYPLTALSSVSRGTVYLPDTLAQNYTNGYAYGKSFTITASRKYSSQDYSYTVGAVITESNYKRLTGSTSSYEELTPSIYMNPEDISQIYDETPITQVSVFVSDTQEKDLTVSELKNGGYKVLDPTEAAAASTAGLRKIRNALQTVVLVVLLVVLYFVSYFITKLIYKSRNVYFSTVRMLGGSRRNCRALLLVDLLTVFHLVFVLTVIVLKLMLAGTIPAPDRLLTLARFITVKNGVFLYLIVLLLTILLAVRYASQMFRKTAMNAYKEEV